MGSGKNQKTKFQPKPEEVYQFDMKRYEDIMAEARHNVKIKWYVLTIFITASFALSAYFFTINLSNRFFFILIILALLWFSAFYTLTWNIANEILLKLRDRIVIKYAGISYDDFIKDMPERVRFSVIMIWFVIGYHLMFFFYSCINLPPNERAFLLYLLIILGVIAGIFIRVEKNIKEHLQKKIKQI